MMTLTIEDLEGLVQEGFQFAAASVSDVPELLSWAARREAIFESLRNRGLQCLKLEQPRAVQLLRQLLKLDAAIIAKLEKELGAVEQEITATNKMKQLLNAQAVPSRPVLLQCVA